MLNKHQQASMASAYALLDASFKEYKKKFVELHGEDALKNVQAEIAKDKYAESELKPEDGMQLFYDEFSGRYFESTIENVLRAEYNINRDLEMQEWAILNDFYDYLGLVPLEGGDRLGWSKDGNQSEYWQTWIDFKNDKITLDDGLEVTIITMFCEPSLGWDDFE